MVHDVQIIDECEIRRKSLLQWAPEDEFCQVTNRQVRMCKILSNAVTKKELRLCFMSLLSMFQNIFHMVVF